MLDLHDTGCKSRMGLLPGAVGSAIYRGDRQEHRLVLERRFTDLLLDEDEAFALWIGMNPSGATEIRDDLTVRKEQNWTQRKWGLRRYIKVNLGSYRWTDSLSLGNAGVPLVHPDNLTTIRVLAARAREIVLTTGKPPEPLMDAAKSVFEALRDDGRTVQCLGVVAAGWPRHSSRIGYGTKFEDFELCWPVRPRVAPDRP